MQRLKLLSFSMAAHEAECRGLSLTGNVPVEGGPVTLWDTETPTHAKLMPSPGFLEGDTPVLSRAAGWFRRSMQNYLSDREQKHIY